MDDESTIIEPLENIVQFIELCSKLISKSNDLDHFKDGALFDNFAIQDVTAHLSALNRGVHNYAKFPIDYKRNKICEKCNSVGDQLLATLKQLTVDNKYQTWTGTRKAITTLLSSEKVEDLEQQLKEIRRELTVYIVDLPRCVPSKSLVEYHTEIINIIDEILPCGGPLRLGTRPCQAAS